jgi:hypothetical protein
MEGDDPNDLVYPYKPPTERGQNLLEMENSIYRDSKYNGSLDIHISNVNPKDD